MKTMYLQCGQHAKCVAGLTFQRFDKLTKTGGEVLPTPAWAVDKVSQETFNGFSLVAIEHNVPEKERGPELEARLFKTERDLNRFNAVADKALEILEEGSENSTRLYEELLTKVYAIRDQVETDVEGFRSDISDLYSQVIFDMAALRAGQAALRNEVAALRKLIIHANTRPRSLHEVIGGL